MLDSLFAALKDVKTWRQVFLIFIVSIIVFISLSPNRFWDTTDSLIEEWILRDNLYIEVRGTRIESLIIEFDRSYNSATGIGVFDREGDVFITYLNPRQTYLWEDLDIQIGHTTKVERYKELQELNIKKCVYLKAIPQPTLFKRSIYHVILCGLNGNTSMLFTFIPSLGSDEIIRTSLLPNLSRLSNKIERLNLTK